MTLAERLRSDLGRPAAGDLLRGDFAEEADAGGTEAAVLVAMTDRSEPGIILTVRHGGMRTHAGQVAFPGGRVDTGEDAEAAALREAWEELGLDPLRVAVVGRLETYRTVTGYLVTPVVGVVPPDLPLAPHEQEVEDWFEAPVTFLLDPANRSRQSVVFQGRQRDYYEIEWNGRRIWGATAAMLVNLSRRLQWR